MSYILPKYQLSNRKIARQFIKEKEKIDQVLLPIENAFCTLILNEDVTDSYESIYLFHLEYFNKSIKMLQPHLYWSILDVDYFKNCYAPVV